MINSKKGSFLEQMHNQITLINDSKIFAGLMIITLNVVSRFVNIKLSKTMESYLKFTLSKQLLVFTIAWMGSRDIYIALGVTICFILFTEYLFNEDSMFCVLSEEFLDYHIAKMDNEMEEAENVSDEDIQKAKVVLEKAKKQNKDKEGFEGFNMK
jgi:hypothetical protein